MGAAMPHATQETVRGLTTAKPGHGNALFALGVAFLRLALELLLVRVVLLGLRLQQERAAREARPRRGLNTLWSHDGFQARRAKSAFAVSWEEH